MTARPMEITLRLSLPQRGKPKRLYLVFNVSRTPVSLKDRFDPGVLVQRDAGELLTGEPSPIPTHPNVLAFEIREPASAREALSELKIVTIGEAPELVRVVAHGDSTLYVAKAGASPCLDTIDLDYQPQAGGVLKAVPGPADYKAQLAQALTAIADPATRDASRFFAELDERTLAVLGATPAMQNAVTVVGAMVQERFDSRLVEHKSKAGKYTAYQVSAGQRPYLLQVAGLFVELASKHFKVSRPARSMRARNRTSVHDRRWDPVLQAGIDPVRYEKAFEDFADGRLRLQLQPSGMWSTQPSSGFYFYFAELALLAAEAKLASPLGAGLWVALANVLVRTQESFCARYSPEQHLDPDRCISDYGACQYREEHELDRPSQVRRDDLRTRFSSKRRLGALSVAAAENAKNLVSLEAP